MEFFSGSQLMYAGAVFIAVLISFIFGKMSGGLYEKKRQEADQREFAKKLLLSESGNNDLKRQIEELKALVEKYVYIVVRIPETVKHLNSSLTFDETISSIIRMTKDLINTDIIEVYLYDDEKNMLTLEAAYGSNRKEAVSFPVGEGLVGKAGQLRLMVSNETGAAPSDDKIMHAAPMIFKGRLTGVLATGRIPRSSGDEKRLIAMLTDLAAVSLQNCEKMTTAQKEANTDSLTKLFNRKAFFERALEETQKALNYNFPISFFMFDIDHFKKYNDQNGHAEGDYLLRELGGMLKKNSRSRDVVARYGGEEFIVMLSNTEKQNAAKYAEKIRKLIETAPFRNREKQPMGFVSISGGIATFPMDGDKIETVIKLADAALYKSKESGRNRVICFEHQNLA